MLEIHKAKIFKNGGSQAIRIPAQWRFDSDTLIAAHALTLEAPLVTNNHKHFSRVPGLRVQNWLQ